MGLTTRIRRSVASWLAPELRSWRDLEGWDVVQGGRRVGRQSVSGVEVTPESALGLSTAYACINALASDIAALPLKLYEARPDGTRVEVRDHPAVELLNVSPDGETTAMRFRQAFIGHMLGWGNGYAEIRFARSTGELERIDLLDPRTEPRRRPQDRRLYYKLHQPGVLDGGETLPPTRVLHFAGLGFDGLRGYCPVTIAREVFGLSIAATEANSAFIGNGSRPSGAVEFPGRFKDKDQRTAFRAEWQAAQGGPGNTGSVVILDQGMKFVPFTINPEDAQFLETRQFQVAEVARYFDVMLNRIQDNSQVQLASAGMEQMTLMYAVFNLTPRCESLEQVLNLRLLSREDRRRGMFFEHNMNALLRGAMKDRAEFYRQLRDLGALTPNMIARFENLEPAGPEGDIRIIPGNMVPLSRAGEQMAAPAAAAFPGDDAPDEEDDDADDDDDAA